MKHLHYAAKEHPAGYGELFDITPAPKKLARSDDPFTSKIAATGVHDFSGNHHRKIHDALKSMRDGTFYEIAEVSGLEPASVWRRLNELEKAGHIRQTGSARLGPTNRLCRVWEAL